MIEHDGYQLVSRIFSYRTKSRLPICTKFDEYHFIANITLTNFLQIRGTFMDVQRLYIGVTVLQFAMKDCDCYNVRS
jgi:hypothetical protein